MHSVNIIQPSSWRKVAFEFTAQLLLFPLFFLPIKKKQQTKPPSPLTQKNKPTPNKQKYMELFIEEQWLWHKPGLWWRNLIWHNIAKTDVFYTFFWLSGKMHMCTCSLTEHSLSHAEELESFLHFFTIGISV